MVSKDMPKHVPTPFQPVFGCTKIWNASFLVPTSMYVFPLSDRVCPFVHLVHVYLFILFLSMWAKSWELSKTHHVFIHVNYTHHIISLYLSVQTMSGSWFQPLWKILVSWHDDIPNLWKNNPAMFQTTNQIPLSTIINHYSPLLTTINHY